MKKTLTMMTVCALVATAAAYDRTDTGAFFNKGTDPGAITLPKDEIYPVGQKLGFSFYSTGGGSETKRGELLPVAQKEADQAKIIASGVTMVGPQYELNGEVAELARKNKIKAVYTIELEIDGEVVTVKTFDRWNKEKRPLPVDQIVADMTKKVKAAAGNPEIAWWDVTPEELRYWRPLEMQCLALMTQVVREHDPLKRPVMMYIPGHYNADGMAKVAKELDIIPKGMYTNYSNFKNNRVWVRWSIEQELQAKAKINRPGQIVLALPEMFEQPKPGEEALLESWARHDTYGALVAGAEGVLVFSASRRPNFPAREAYLDAYLKIAGELSGELELGKIFLFGTREDDLELQIKSGPETVKLPLKDKDVEYPSVSMANLAYDHSRYVVLVNSSNEAVTCAVAGLPYSSKVMVKNLFGTRPAFVAPEGDFEVQLPPLGVAAFRIYLDK